MEFKVIPNEQTPEVPWVQDEFIADYIEKHRETLEAFLEFAKTRGNAVGLAANQCAIFAGDDDDEDGERFMVRAFALGGREQNWRIIIDPTVIGHGIKEQKAEGCLTWKGRVIVAERYRTVEVTYYDMEGNLHSGEVYKGFDAQIWQHEVNHLNGVEEEVRDFFAEPPPIQVGRNEKCPCGSGKKYKNCCWIM
jgi:peptide deformylase